MITGELKAVASYQPDSAQDEVDCSQRTTAKFHQWQLRPHSPDQRLMPGAQKAYIGLSNHSAAYANPAFDLNPRPLAFNVQALLVNGSLGSQPVIPSGHSDFSLAVMVGNKLRSIYRVLGGMLSQLHYELSGNFAYLTPKERAQLFTLRAIHRLHPEFTTESATVRKEAIEHFKGLITPTHGVEEDQFEYQAFLYFIESVHRCLDLEHEFHRWERAGLPETDKACTSMHALLIEGRRCPDDFHRFVFEDEPGYLERCYRGLLFLLNKRSETPDKPVSMADLTQVSAIIGTSLCSKVVDYGVAVPSDADNSALAMLMKNGLIKNESQLTPEKFRNRLKRLIGDSFTVDEAYAVAGDVKKKMATSEPYFLFTLYFAAPKMLCFKVRYVSEDKHRDCQELLDQYYRTVATKTTMSDVVESAVTLCCELQRRHPFADGNGRILFFMLLPYLLSEKNIWISHTLEDPWSLIDNTHPKNITKKLFPLCEYRQMNRKPVNWHLNLPEDEHIRLLCTMGETKAFIDKIEQQPELLYCTFRPSNRTLLEMAAHHDKKEIVTFILDHHPDTVAKETLIDLLDHLEQCGTDQEMIEIIENHMEANRILPVINR